VAYCGDGDVDKGEECDDGNEDTYDACINTCTMNVCGDGIVWA
jgi:cysteine-rich repeat protein